jgi:hypothetical protein
MEDRGVRGSESEGAKTITADDHDMFDFGDGCVGRDGEYSEDEDEEKGHGGGMRET